MSDMPYVICPGCKRKIEFVESEYELTFECVRCDARFQPLRPAAPVEEEADDSPDAAHSLPRFTCPYCGTHDGPMTRSRVSPAGWVVFVVLLLSLFCFPFCILGLLIREEYNTCSCCGLRIG